MRIQRASTAYSLLIVQPVVLVTDPVSPCRAANIHG